MNDYKVGTAIASFGVATASLYMTPSAEAAVIDLTPSPSEVSQGTYSFGLQIEFGIPGGNPDLFQYNGLGSSGTNFNSFSGGSFSGGAYLYDIVGFRRATNSSTINIDQTFDPTIGPRAGVRYWGFLTRDNKVGWFKVDLNYDGNQTIRYLAGAYEDTETSIKVGEVPLPASLPLLASALGLLAAGASRKHLNKASEQS